MKYKTQPIPCPACGHENDVSKQFCKSCGKWLNNIQSNIENTSEQNSSAPVAGCLSVLAIPFGIIFSIIFIKNVGVQDSWGFGILIFVILFVLGAAIVGVISGVFAVTPGKGSIKQSNANSTLGIVGMIISFAVIFIILLLFKR